MVCFILTVDLQLYGFRCWLRLVTIISHTRVVTSQVTCHVSHGQHCLVLGHGDTCVHVCGRQTGFPGHPWLWVAWK